MAQILPMRATTYNPAAISSLEAVVAPPYDVLSPEEQTALYERDPHNYVRVILNRAESGDTELSPYQRAATYLQDWTAQGVLQRDREPGLYALRQEFTDPRNGQRLSRGGFYCALKLSPYSDGVVLPHEETRTKARTDRLHLMRATKANPEPIFGLYEDPLLKVESILEAAAPANPDMQIDVDGDLHEIRRVTNPQTIGQVQRLLAESRIWIADGHHRYETALNYRDELAVAGTAMPEADYIMIVLAAFTDPGMVVLPTHRLIKGVRADRLEILNSHLHRYFDMEPATQTDLAHRMQMAAARGKHAFGLVRQSGPALLTLREDAVMDRAAPAHCPDWRNLDVSILQALVLERSLGIPESALATTPDIGYTRDIDEAWSTVAAETYQLAFLLNDPMEGEVRRVAAAGDKMPPKSTFFYPKLWSGLVLRTLQA